MTRVEDLITAMEQSRDRSLDRSAMDRRVVLNARERHVLIRALMSRIRELQRQGAGAPLSEPGMEHELYTAFQLLERLAMG
jgi:hypothetical protein